MRIDSMIALQLVEGIDVRLGGSDDDIGVGADAVDDPPALCKTHGHLALTLGSLGDRIDRIEQQLGAALGHAFDSLESRVHRAVAVGVGLALLTGLAKHKLRVRVLSVAACLAHAY